MTSLPVAEREGVEALRSTHRRTVPCTVWGTYPMVRYPPRGERL